MAAAEKSLTGHVITYIIFLALSQANQVNYHRGYLHNVATRQSPNFLSSLPSNLARSTEERLGQEHASRTDKAVEAIEHYIVENKLSPGDSLPSEADFCNHLGMSRSSVREAVCQLQALDIVNTKRGKGAFVSNMSLSPLVKTLILRSSLRLNSINTLSEVVSLREFLDSGIGSELIRARDEINTAELRALVEKMIVKSATGRSYIEEDIAFHRGLIAKLNNTLLDEMMSAMWLIHMAVVPSLPADLPGLVATAKAHGAMLEAVENADLTAYYAAVQDHYQPLRTRISEAEHQKNGSK